VTGAAPENPTGLDFGAGQHDYEAKLQLAPVVDLVLFLIWFYLMVGQLVMHQKDSTVELPRMDQAAAAQELPAEVVVNLRQDGQVTVSGQGLGSAALEDELRRLRARAQAGGEPLRVVVRADRRQTYARLDEVLRSCRRAGLKQVVFRAAEGGAE
jgi:biopolymer transport protein ExbD